MREYLSFLDCFLKQLVVMIHLLVDYWLQEYWKTLLVLESRVLEELDSFWVKEQVSLMVQELIGLAESGP